MTTRRKRTPRSKIKTLLNLTKISAEAMSDDTEMLENVAKYEELLNKTDDEIEQYIKDKQ